MESIQMDNLEEYYSSDTNSEMGSSENGTSSDENCGASTQHTISSAIDSVITQTSSARRLLIGSFNHTSHEVSCLETTVHFYTNFLGFVIIPRPDFEAEGYWMHGYGMCFHIVLSRYPEEHRLQALQKMEDNKKSMPRCDHIAFISSNLDAVKELLVENSMYFHESYPLKSSTAIRQLFFFDPDGNVIEISNCGPPIGKISCDDDE
jgi:catechol 2,3-dioxygenase-like lactoylglutathione lyase family enzyme